MSTLHYRADIDGLRALAIVPVVWFHSGLPGADGGFTGVDTFFVISGFLITAIIAREIDAGTFSFRHFYARRIRRIAPALLTVILATLISGTALLLPYELEGLGYSAIAAILMVPNVYFWSEAGYFALGEQYAPLLHTWSLGVEEQFYLFFPFVLMAGTRLRGRFALPLRRIAIVAIAGVSFGLSIVATYAAPSAAFYLLPTRVWELMIGGMLALGIVSLPDRFRTVSSFAGFACLGWSTFFISEADAFPGYIAAVPVTGAALLIAAGERSPVNRVLSIAPLVWLGKISYSLYLWHWPVFVLGRRYLGVESFAPTQAMAALFLSVGLAWLSHRFIEVPFRRGTFSFPKLARYSLAGAATACLLSLVAVFGQGLPSRLTPEARLLLSVRNDLPERAHVCVGVSLERAIKRCQFGGNGPVRWVVWGDSHAATMGAAAAGAFDRSPGVVISSNTCPPTDGWVGDELKGSADERCRARNADVAQWLVRDDRIDTILLSANWAGYDEDIAVRDASVARLVNFLGDNGKTVVVLAGIPDPGTDVPRAAALAEQRGDPMPDWTCDEPLPKIGGGVILDLRTISVVTRPR